MAKIDKNATPLVENIDSDTARVYSVISKDIDLKKLKAEKIYLESRLAEINAILGA